MKTRWYVLIAVVLAAFCFIWICIMGQTYTLEIELRDHSKDPADYTATIDPGSDGEACFALVDKQVRDGKLALTMKSLKPGHAYIEVLGPDGFAFMEGMHVGRFGVLMQDYYLGACTGDEIIPWVIFLYLGFVMIGLVRDYRKSIRANLYQHRNVRLLGMIIFLAFLLVSEISRMISYPGFIYSVRSVLRSGSSFSMFALPVAFVVSLVVLVSNIRLMQREGKSWRNMLACILGAMICIGSIAPLAMQEYLQWHATGIDVHNEGGAALYVTTAIECVATMSVTYLECILLGTVILGIKAARKVPAFDKDYMLILGCQIREDGTLTPLLKGRADRAIEFANMQKEKTGKDLVFVPSGGQGSDEVLSEADAIHNYLVGTGIPEERILVENQSVNTLENFRNSWRLIREREGGAQADPKIAFSTTNYHVFRSGILASEQGIHTEGIGSGTRSYFWINAFVREFIANLFAERKTHIKTIAVLIILILVMVLTVYYSVNR